MIIFSCDVIFHGYKAPTLRWFYNDDVELTSYMDNPVDEPDKLRYYICGNIFNFQHNRINFANI